MTRPKTGFMRDFDPENDDFEGESSTARLKSLKKGASATHGHLSDYSSAKNISLEGYEGDKKYAGTKVSRKQAFVPDFSHESELEEASGQETGSDGELEFSGSDEELEFSGSDEELEFFDSDEAEEQLAGNRSGLAAKLRELEIEQDENSASTEAASHSALQMIKPSSSEVNRPLHLRNQLKKFDAYVDVKFKMQPLLNQINRLPSNAIRRVPKSIRRELEACSEEAEKLARDFVDLQLTELSNDGLFCMEDVSMASADESLQKLWNEMSLADSALDPLLSESLEKWHTKSLTSSVDFAKKSTTGSALRTLNQDPYRQVELAMQDFDRLLKRAQTYRNGQQYQRIGKAADVSDVQSAVFDDIFDDNDFFQVLLKDWTATHGSAAIGSSITAVATTSANKQNRKSSDAHSVKGRKMRFDVHAKLVNYMVPQMEPGAWSDAKMDEFFASLLGKAC
jgi:protein AATF/BFR2